MADLKLDPITRDLIIGSEPEWTTGIGTVLQRVLLRLSAFKGEWAFNLDYGLDPLLGTTDRRAASAAIRKLIVDTEGVDELTSYSVTFDGVTRELSVRFRVRAGAEYADGSLDL